MENTEGRGKGDYERLEAKKIQNTKSFFFFCICMKKNKEKHKGGVRAREHSDIAMLPRSM